MASINTATARRYLWSIGKDDPANSAFLQAQGLSPAVMEARTLYDKLMERHRARIEKYRYFWNLYAGNHWLNFGDAETETPSSAVNFCATAVDKHRAFLMNKGFLVESDFPEIEKFLQHTWDVNGAGEKDHNLFGLVLATACGVTGDQWIHVGAEVHPLTQEEYIKFTLLNSLRCFPVLEREDMLGLLEYGPDSFVQNINNGFAEYEDVYHGVYYGKGVMKILRDEKEVQTISLNIPELPLEHIQNLPFPLSHYGFSDLLNVTELNMAFDNDLTNGTDIVNYHASPITVLSGAKIGDLVRGPNRVWGIPKDASLANLELKGDLTALNTHMKQIREAIAEVSNVPESTIGKMQSISNTSAVALAITYMPLYEVMEVKRIQYGTTFLKLNARAIRWAMLKGWLKPSTIVNNALARWKKEFGNEAEEVQAKYKPFAVEYTAEQIAAMDSPSVILDGKKLPPELFQTYLTWFPPLPRDEVLDADLAVSLTNAGLWSRRNGRARIGMSEKESILMEKEIAKEPRLDNALSMTNKTGLEGAGPVKGQNESLRQQREGHTKGA